MEEKGISLAGFLPKSISSMNLGNFDVIVNLSEYGLPDTTTRVLKNALQDPMTGDEDAFRDVREDVEQVVRRLIEQFRVARQWNAGINSLYSKECAPASSSL